MAEFTIQTTQEFSVTYSVMADSPEEAWQRLNDSGPLPQCESQFPGDITGTFDDAYIEEAE
jgi:hypothetical protein